MSYIGTLGPLVLCSANSSERKKNKTFEKGGSSYRVISQNCVGQSGVMTAIFVGDRNSGGIVWLAQVAEQEVRARVSLYCGDFGYWMSPISIS